jgi:predicted alpha/beta-fold hydrolase
MEQEIMMYEYHLRQSKRIFPRSFQFALALWIALSLSASSIEAAGYQYPYHDPYLATATSAILSDDGATPRVDSTIVRVPGLPGRNHLPALEGRGDVSLALYRQNRAAPLLFILAGLGSSPYFGVAPYLASLFHREGFHVVVLPSPMSWNFALSASRSGAPGYTPEDAQDLYDVMQKTLTAVRSQYNVKTTSINFIGVSLGALEGAYLSVIDGDARKIDIDKYLLINPPLDVAFAVKTIDEWNGLKEKFGREKSQEIISKALAIVNSFAEERHDKAVVFDRLAKKFSGFTKEEFQFLIAENLQNQLPELIYVTQIIHDQNVLTSAKDDKRKRLEEAKDFTFKKYNQMIAMPRWQKQFGDPQIDLDTFMERGSLAAIDNRLRDNPKVHILHNADDFLAERKSIEALKDTLGDRVTIFPYGGHLGNLWYSENKEYAVKYFRPDAYARN